MRSLIRYLSGSRVNILVLTIVFVFGFLLTQSSIKIRSRIPVKNLRENTLHTNINRENAQHTNTNSNFNNQKPKIIESLISAQTLTKPILNPGTTTIEQSEVTQDLNANVRLFNLSKDFVPESTYIPIRCKKSARIADTQTTLCVHDIAKDVHVSGAIWNTGVWERNILSSYLSYIDRNPSWLVLDIGAQIGQYSLFAAKKGRKVLTVEPFYDNILRIHKAAKTEGIENKITLVQNALSNKRNEIKRLQPNSNNIGGQTLLNFKNVIYQRKDMETDKYLVETVLLNDIVKFLPLNDAGLKYDSAILKLDIEGFEPFMFQHADEFFKAIKIQIIFMEWGNLPGQRDEKEKIEQMISFLLERNFEPVGNGKKLDRKNWLTWPWDIEWKRSDNQAKMI